MACLSIKSHSQGRGRSGLLLTFLLLFQDRLPIRKKRWPGPRGWEGVFLDISGNERPQRIIEEVENPVLTQKKIGKGFDFGYFHACSN